MWRPSTDRSRFFDQGCGEVELDKCLLPVDLFMVHSRYGDDATAHVIPFVSSCHTWETSGHSNVTFVFKLISSSALFASKIHFIIVREDTASIRTDFRFLDVQTHKNVMLQTYEFHWSTASGNLTLSYHSNSDFHFEPAASSHFFQNNGLKLEYVFFEVRWLPFALPHRRPRTIGRLFLVKVL